jgi:hypothetical protein
MVAYSIISKILLFTATLLYIGHGYWYNTIDFAMFVPHMKVPVRNSILKCCYALSFVLSIVSATLFVIQLLLDPYASRWPGIRYTFLALSVVLLAGAVAVVARPRLDLWPKKT